MCHSSFQCTPHWHAAARTTRPLLCVAALAALALAAPAWPQATDAPAASAQPNGQVAPLAPSTVVPSEPAKGHWSWLNPATAPFIPVPEIAVDPDSGTTVGILPTWVQTDAEQHIRRIIAPDLLYNPYFGYGAHARVFAYPSEDEQWSVVAALWEHVQRGLDGEYQIGRLRQERWSFNYSAIYDRNGTPRFYGIGNDSPAIAETDYTEQQELLEAQIGYNLTPNWQLAYTGLVRSVDVLPGTLAHIASIQTRFGRILGEGTNNEYGNRVSIIYDTRDSLVVPSRGMAWVGYGGLASRAGLFNDSMYTEAGIDGRAFWSFVPGTILATHMALRYLPETHHVPFWALSGIGGGESEIGGEQILRGYGAGRYYDRDSFAANVELRQRVAAFETFSTRIELEVAPFVDLGRVFSQPSTWPLSQLHSVGGLGIRGIARPSVVGRVDIGYGSSGVAVFTGISYPF
jgi:hypothetical protein